ncbi:MAG: hypothetical protein ACFFER_05460 [Candidatus Thorarchaeota archaeon]
MTARDFLIWIAIPAPLLLLNASFGFVYSSQLSPDDVMISTLDSSANIFSLGIPLFLGAGLILTSAGSRKHIYSAKAKSPFSLLLFRMLFLTIVHSAYQLTLMMLTFLATAQQPLTAPLNPYYLGGFLAAGVIISVFLSPVASAVALWIDDWRWSTISGIGICYALTLMGGPSYYPVAFPEIALLAPMHLYRAIGVSLAAVEFASPSAMVHYVGFFFTAENLVVPIIFYIGLAFASTLIGKHVLMQDIHKWHQHRSWIEEDNGMHDDAADAQSQDVVASKGLLSDVVQRRRVFAAVLVPMILLVPIAGFNYVASYRQHSEVVVYETPGTGVVLSIGEWLYGAFEASEPPAGVNRMISYQLKIVDWGSAPDEIWFVHSCRPYTLNEFEMMNDTEREDAGYAGGSLMTSDRTEYDGAWWGLSGIWGTQVWAIRFLDSSWNVTAGSLVITLRVVLGDSR